jgi:hypothetical protein
VGLGFDVHVTDLKVIVESETGKVKGSKVMLKKVERECKYKARGRRSNQWKLE